MDPPDYADDLYLGELEPAFCRCPALSGFVYESTPQRSIWPMAWEFWRVRSSRTADGSASG